MRTKVLAVPEYSLSGCWSFHFVLRHCPCKVGPRLAPSSGGGFGKAASGELKIMFGAEIGACMGQGDSWERGWWLE